MNHAELNIVYPNIPFIWHYNDFANIYPSLEQKKITFDEFKLLNNKYKLNTLNIYNNADYYIHKQYLKDKYIYDNVSNEFYIGFHTWLLKQLEGDDYEIGSNDVYYNFSFKCSLFPIYGEISTHYNFPEKKMIIHQKPVKIINGINVINNIYNLENDKLFKRNAIIHKHQGITRFSPYQTCNFIIPKKNNKIVAFVSIITDPTVYIKNNNIINNTIDINYDAVKQINKSCITYHIIQNVFDSENINDIKSFCL
jgi:hypothetical protein